MVGGHQSLNCGCAWRSTERWWVGEWHEACFQPEVVLCYIEVNELPLSLIISWYEQKAVCVL
ncbi:MAG: hypothetical protein JRI64_06155, partial [Deltaproteobacteria bacterium]|nr:hypothetical protein [Deltaproteobacteria bacterium]